MNNNKWLLVGLLAVFSLPAVAEVYRHVDRDGNVTFSDEPSNGSEEVKVRPVTTITLPKMKDIESRNQQPSATDSTDITPYERIDFNAPENDSAFYSGSGDVEFQVTSSPPLKQGHRYEVDLNGQPVGQNPSGSFTVRNIDRGTHSASAYIVDSTGQRIQGGSSVTFTIHRPSVINRNRAN